MESEFLNRPFKAWLKPQNIEHFHTHNFDTKAAIVERFIRTKKKALEIFSHTNSRQYVDVLSLLLLLLLVNAYNNSYHTLIKRAPSTINPENQKDVWHALYLQPILKEPKLKVNDKLRLFTNRIRFRKDYLPGWTDEIVQVARVYKGNPSYYKSKDLGGDILIGSFYKKELKKICKYDDVFRIETIIKKM